MAAVKHFTMTDNQNEVLVTKNVSTGLFGEQPRQVYTIGADNNQTIYVSTEDQARVYRLAHIALTPHKVLDIAGQVARVDRAGLNAIFLGAEITNIGAAQVHNKVYWWYTGVGFAKLLMDTGPGLPARAVFAATWVAQTAHVWPAFTGIAVPAPTIDIHVRKGLDRRIEVAALAAIWLKVWGMRMA